MVDILAVVVCLAFPFASLGLPDDGTCSGESNCAAEGLQYFANWTEGKQASGTWEGIQSNATLMQDIPGEGHVASPLFVARKIVGKSFIKQLLSHVQSLNFESEKADSIDGDPTFEYYIYEKGKVKHKKLYKLVNRLLNERLVPYVARVLQCETCVVCDVLLRRFLPGERRGVQIHQDILAYATGILTLNADDFSGGYFVSRHKHSSQPGRGGEQLFLPLDTGDFLVHKYDVLHGVNVTHGTRISMVAWFKDRDGLCSSDENPWYVELAGRGNVHAAFRAAQSSLNGLGGLNDLTQARSWMLMAAEGGITDAMIELSRLMHFGKGGPEDVPGAVKWLRQASAAGRRDAMVILAWYVENGVGCEANKTEALHWYSKAAELGHPAAVQWMNHNSP